MNLALHRLDNDNSNRDKESSNSSKAGQSRGLDFITQTCVLCFSNHTTARACKDSMPPRLVVMQTEVKMGWTYLLNSQLIIKLLLGLSHHSVNSKVNRTMGLDLIYLFFFFKILRKNVSEEHIQL